MGPPFNYLVTGRSPGGRRVAAVVRADSGDLAVKEFEAKGNTDVVLHTDDFAAPIVTQKAKKQVFTLLEQAALPEMGSVRRFGLYVWKGYCNNLVVTILAIAVLAVSVVLDESLFGFEYLAVAWLLLPVIVNLYLIWFGPGAKFVRLLRAVGEARWETALRLVPQIKLPLTAYELPMLKARSLAGLGRLAEALQEIDRLVDDPKFPRDVYWMSQAMVYQDAREPVKILEAIARAHEIAPNKSFIILSYANRLLSVRRDVRRARTLIAEARRHAVSATTVKFQFYAEGFLALEEGRTADAVELLGEAVRRMERYVRWDPSLLGVAARMRARLCLACAAAGDTASARRHFRRAAPLLAAHQEYELLQQCEQAAG